jgi:hypothetical protein
VRRYPEKQTKACNRPIVIIIEITEINAKTTGDRELAEHHNSSFPGGVLRES